ncbi:hypothetical protein B0H66DRAFT_527699 [Apodospora peruviana]|uniref:Uncharacterized protein n=1 Tax=Apodospora peruviana TaxID=516989 RepID=A0AAE0IS84_9PEZI|nr:hypothetical protein B0H66DRAFT_527699 [Apodospora peruviana]
MSTITRAFTTRRVKQSLIAAEAADSMPQRSNTTKGAIGGSIRHKISAPVELIHTTNMLSYNAPDIYPKTASSTSSSSTRSDDEMSDSAPTTASSPPTSPDVESSPKRSLSPEPNHLSCYFTPPFGTVEAKAETKSAEAPIIPQRSVSHTKRSQEMLVRQRSMSRMSEQSQRTVSTKASFSFSRSSSISTNTAATLHSSTPPQHKTKVSNISFSSPPPSAALPAPPVSQSNQHRKEFSQSQHPFGPELAQVTEIAEEYGVKEQLNEVDAEQQEMFARGLLSFTAVDYLAEIQGLYASPFTTIKPTATAVWI